MKCVILLLLLILPLFIQNYDFSTVNNTQAVTTKPSLSLRKTDTIANPSKSFNEKISTTINSGSLSITNPGTFSLLNSIYTNIYVYSSAIVTLSNVTITGNLQTYNSSSVIINSNTAISGNIVAYDQSSVSVNAGSNTSFYAIFVFDQANFTMNNVDSHSINSPNSIYVQAYQLSHIIFTNVSIPNVNLEIYDNSSLQIDNLTLQSSPTIGWPASQIGIYNNASASINLLRNKPGISYSNFNFVSISCFSPKVTIMNSVLSKFSAGELTPGNTQYENISLIRTIINGTSNIGGNVYLYAEKSTFLGPLYVSSYILWINGQNIINISPQIILNQTAQSTVITQDPEKNPFNLNNNQNNSQSITDRIKSLTLIHANATIIFEDISQVNLTDSSLLINIYSSISTLAHDSTSSTIIDQTALVNDNYFVVKNSLINLQNTTYNLLYIFDSATVSLANSTIRGGLFTYNSSIITISGNTHIYGKIFANDQSLIHIESSTSNYLGRIFLYGQSSFTLANSNINNHTVFVIEANQASHILLMNDVFQEEFSLTLYGHSSLQINNITLNFQLNYLLLNDDSAAQINLLKNGAGILSSNFLTINIDGLGSFPSNSSLYVTNSILSGLNANTICCGGVLTSYIDLSNTLINGSTYLDGNVNFYAENTSFRDSITIKSENYTNYRQTIMLSPQIVLNQTQFVFLQMPFYYSYQNPNTTTNRIQSLTLIHTNASISSLYIAKVNLLQNSTIILFESSAFGYLSADTNSYLSQNTIYTNIYTLNKVSLTTNSILSNDTLVQLHFNSIPYNAIYSWSNYTYVAINSPGSVLNIPAPLYNAPYTSSVTLRVWLENSVGKWMYLQLIFTISSNTIKLQHSMPGFDLLSLLMSLSFMIVIVIVIKRKKVET